MKSSFEQNKEIIGYINDYKDQAGKSVRNSIIIALIGILIAVFNWLEPMYMMLSGVFLGFALSSYFKSDEHSHNFDTIIRKLDPHGFLH